MQMQIRQPLHAKLSDYSSLVLHTEARVTEDAQKETADLGIEVIKTVKQLNLFSNAELGDGKGVPERTLLVRVAIIDIKRVDPAARFLFGSFAGKTLLTVDVTFLDGFTGQTLGAFEVTSEPPAGGILSNEIGKAVEKTAERIFRLIMANYR